VNPVLAWSKKNWPILVSGVVIMGSLPTAWYFSDAWNKKIKETQQSAASAELQKTKVSVEYVARSPIPGQPDFTMKDAPNDEITKSFVKMRDELARQTKVVIDRVTAFNKGAGPDAQAVGRTGHAVLVADLFPGPTQARINQQAFPGMDDAAIQSQPADKREAALAKASRDMTEPAIRQMVDRLVANREYPDLYAAMVKGANAGSPPALGEVLLAVQDRVTRERERMFQTPRDATPEEQAQLAKIAQQTRLGRYQGATKGFSVYMTREALGAPGAPAAAGSSQGVGLRSIPSAALFRVDQALENDKDLFLFQWDQWIMQDVLAAVRLANTDQGKATSVDQSVVKRVDRLATLTFPALEMGGGNETQNPNLAPPAVTNATPGAEVKPDYKVSITGRTTSASNPDYDVRNVMVVAVVSSERLPTFLNALSRVNFNTVLQVQLAEVDVKGDLEKGYYYGNEHVVRATVTLETVWLRNWTGPLMPASVKKALGVTEPAPEAK
jgi:hypothetical protein